MHKRNGSENFPVHLLKYYLFWNDFFAFVNAVSFQLFAWISLKIKFTNLQIGLPFQFPSTGSNSLYNFHNMHIVYGAFISQIEIGVAVIWHNRTMFNRHKTQISIWKCAYWWCQLCWTKWITISQVFAILWIKMNIFFELQKIRRNEIKLLCDSSFDSATIQKVYSHWSTGARKGRMSAQIPTTLDPSLTQRMLMNSYSSANHDDMHTIAGRNGKFSSMFLTNFVEKLISRLVYYYTKNLIGFCLKRHTMNSDTVIDTRNNALFSIRKYDVIINHRNKPSWSGNVGFRLHRKSATQKYKNLHKNRMPMFCMKVMPQDMHKLIGQWLKVNGRLKNTFHKCAVAVEKRKIHNLKKKGNEMKWNERSKQRTKTKEGMVLCHFCAPLGTFIFIFFGFHHFHCFLIDM